MRYDIPCPHQTDSMDTKLVLADYYPLTKEEVYELINLSVNPDRIKPDPDQTLQTCLLQIYIRLVQGIPYKTCPYEITGRFAELHLELDNLWTDISIKHTPEKLTDLIMAIYAKGIE